MSQLSNTLHSATLTVKSVMVQPKTVASTVPAQVWTTTTATAENTPELSGVWCPLLMTVANNTFFSNKKRSIAFDGNSSVLYKPQIHYNNAYKNENNNNNKDKDKNNKKALRIYKQQHLYHCQPQPHNTIQYPYPYSGCHSSCCCCYSQTKSRLYIATTINPQIAEHIKDTNNLKVACGMDTNKNMDTASCPQNCSSSIMSARTKTSINCLLFLIISHESHHFLILMEECYPLKESFILENSSPLVCCEYLKNEEMRSGSIKTTNVIRKRIKSLALLEGVLIGNNIESFSTISWKCKCNTNTYLRNEQLKCANCTN